MNLFPIQILATDKYGWADSSDLAKSLWKSRNKNVYLGMVYQLQ